MNELFYDFALLAIFVFLVAGAVYLFRSQKRGTPRSARPLTADEQRRLRLQALEKLRNDEGPDSGWVDVEEGEGEDEGEYGDIRSTGHIPIEGPPEFIRAVELQRAYWTFNEEERARLEERGLEHLSWRERLRLHHLICLGRLGCLQTKADSVLEVATEKCRELSLLLMSAESPYRPRPGVIWRGFSPPREPDLLGEIVNSSLTHLGCLEIYRLDSANQPIGIDFVSFDELYGIEFYPGPQLIGAARLFYDDVRTENVLVPMLYGLTWAIGDEPCREGRLTSFVAHLVDEEIFKAFGWNPGLGVGRQDLFILRPDSRPYCGLGSMAEISFLLGTSDPRFDAWAKVRGLDPDKLRRGRV